MLILQKKCEIWIRKQEIEICTGIRNGIWKRKRKTGIPKQLYRLRVKGENAPDYMLIQTASRKSELNILSLDNEFTLVWVWVCIFTLLF